MTEAITRDITVRSRGMPEIIDYVQGTNAVPIIFTFRDWTVPSGAEARIFVKKPSGKEVYNAASISENAVTVNPTTQMFAESGLQEGQIQILSGDDILATFLIVFRIEKNIISESAVESSNEYGILDGLIEEARAAVTSANNAAQSASTAAGAANTAAGNANIAASAANSAASSANTAAGKANSATSAANNAASAANQAKEDADAAAQRANDAAAACESILDGTDYSIFNDRITKLEELIGNVIATE